MSQRKYFSYMYTNKCFKDRREYTEYTVYSLLYVNKKCFRSHIQKINVIIYIYVLMRFVLHVNSASSVVLELLDSGVCGGGAV